jgi:hypothetical protein
MPAAGFRAIEVFPVRLVDHPSGDVRLGLYDTTGEAVARGLVRSATVPAADFVRGSSFRFEFAPLLDSKDGDYRFDIASSTSNPVKGVALWATKGTGYDGGALLVNGSRRWADLTFRTEAPVLSVWQLLMALRLAQPARAYVVLVAFFVTWLCFGVLLRALSSASLDETVVSSEPFPVTGTAGNPGPWMKANL